MPRQKGAEYLWADREDKARERLPLLAADLSTCEDIARAQRGPLIDESLKRFDAEVAQARAVIRGQQRDEFEAAAPEPLGEEDLRLAVQRAPLDGEAPD